MRFPMRFGVATIVACLAALLLAVQAAEARKSKRYGIEAKFLSYDEKRQVFKVLVLSRSAGGFGGSTVGDEAPKDVKPKEEMELSVSPEGSVLKRTVIKSSDGTGVDKTGTQDGFRTAVQAIPTDRSVALSITENDKAKTKAGAPKYRIMTVVIKLSPEEIRRRLREILGDEADDVEIE